MQERTRSNGPTGPASSRRPGGWTLVIEDGKVRGKLVLGIRQFPAIKRRQKALGNHNNVPCLRFSTVELNSYVHDPRSSEEMMHFFYF